MTAKKMVQTETSTSTAPAKRKMPMTAREWQIHTNLGGADMVAEDLTSALKRAESLIRALLGDGFRNRCEDASAALWLAHELIIRPVMDVNHVFGTQNSAPHSEANKYLNAVVAEHVDCEHINRAMRAPGARLIGAVLHYLKSEAECGRLTRAPRLRQALD